MAAEEKRYEGSGPFPRTGEWMPVADPGPNCGAACHRAIVYRTVPWSMLKAKGRLLAIMNDDSRDREGIRRAPLAGASP